MSNYFLAFKLDKFALGEPFCHFLNKISYPESVRWVPQANLHITVIYFGGLQQQECEYLKQTVASVTEQFSACDIHISNYDFFHRPRKTPVVLNINSASGKLFALHEALKRQFFDLVKVHQYREFNPHITLGRADNIEQPIKDFMQLIVEKFANQTYLVDQLDLMHYDNQQHRYQIDASFKLVAL